ncbi:hypothetical protein [Morganella morganii]|uniref:hypothetical protein n=1 Tax=Morganella morganii TaxID=582 RepID=UPI002DF16BE9|nr:hypothetical protein [Morganella morganii]
MEFPQSYNFDSYIAWHNEHVDNKVDLKVFLEEKREYLKNNWVVRLKALSELLNYTHSILMNISETMEGDISMLKCDIMLEKQLNNDIQDELVSSDRYDSIFKSVDSIVNKVWRKNKKRKDGFLGVDSIDTEIKDLIRSSVIVNSHGYARDYCKVLKAWHTNLGKYPQPPDRDYSDIDDIFIEQEAKMASGYFAYHADVIYKDGSHVEIQIYTQLNDIWRKLSHKLYERTRLSEDIEYGHGTSASRLVSLGHLLHLAECEAERLQVELNNKC